MQLRDRTVYHERLAKETQHAAQTRTRTVEHGRRRNDRHVHEHECAAHRGPGSRQPTRLRVGLRGELVEMFNAKTMARARRKSDEIAADYAEASPRAVERLDAGFDDEMTVMKPPEALRRVVRAPNHLERLNGEVKRGSSAVKVFPSADSIARLICQSLLKTLSRVALPQIPFRLYIHTNRLPICIGECGDNNGSHHQAEDSPSVRKKG